MRILQFVEDSPPYTIGEKAGFDDGVAAKIVGRGAAVYVEEVDGSAPAETPVIVPDTAVGDGPDSTPIVSTLQPSSEAAPVAPAGDGDGPVSDGEVDFTALSDDELRDLIEKRDGRRPNARASRETLIEKAKGGAPDAGDAD